MKKRIVASITALMILITSVVFTGAFTAFAADKYSFALAAKGSVAVKASASSGANTLYTLKDKEYITGLKDASDGWYQVEYASGKKGYVSEGSVSKVSESYVAAVNISSGSLNIRSGAGTSYSKVGSLSAGDYIVVISKENDWAKILYNGVSTGYVSCDYILKVSVKPTASSDVTDKVIDKLISIALAEEGYREGKNNYSKYGEYFNNPNSAWCDAFVLWCVNKTDTALYGTAFPKLRGCTTIMNWYKGKDEFYAKGSGYIPKAGDLVFYNSSGATSSSTHIGLVTGYSDGYYTSIEGNYSDKVTARRVSVTYKTVIGFVSPDYSYAKNLIATFTNPTTTTRPTTTTKPTTTTTKKTTTTTKPTSAVTRVSKTIPADMAAYAQVSPKTNYAAAPAYDTEEVTEEIILAETTTTSLAASTTTSTTSNKITTEAVAPQSEKIEVEEPLNLVATVEVTALNMRSCADIGSDKVSVLPLGRTAKVLNETEDYYQILLENDRVGYVQKEYVSVYEDETSFGVVDADALNVRASADESAEKIAVLSDNEPLTILEKSDDWYKVELSDGNIGYVLGCFIVD